MAYDRYEGRGDQRGWRDDDRQRGYGRGGEQNERGFFERAKEEVASWFGDEESERRRMQDDRRSHPESTRYGRQDQDGDRGGMFGGGQSTSYGRGREQGDYRNQYGRGGGESGGFGGGDYSRQNRSSWMDRDDDDRGSGRYPGTLGQSHGSHSPGGFGHDDDRSGFGREQGQQGGYRPMTGDYGRGGGGRGESQYRSGMGGQDFNRAQYGRQDFSQDQDQDRGSSGQRYNYGGWGDDDSRRQSQGRSGYSSSSFGGSNTPGQGASAFGGGRHDEHYSSWRQRQIEELDRDYDEYRREHQSKFESEFGSWRQQRQTKRQMLQSIQEHAEVVDQNGEHVGTVDKVRGDTVILTKNDPEAGGVHRSFTCTLLERVEGDKVYLGGTKDSIRSQLRTEPEGGDRNRDGGSSGGIFSGLFGGDRDDAPQESSPATGKSAASATSKDSKEVSSEGPHILDRSFSGTYDDKK